MKNIQRNPFDGEANEDQIKLRQIEETRRKKLKLAYANVLKSRDGREVVLHLLEMTQVFVSSFNTNALSMSYAEGRRSIGLDVLRQIEPESVQQLLKEYHERN